MEGKEMAGPKPRHPLLLVYFTTPSQKRMRIVAT